MHYFGVRSNLSPMPSKNIVREFAEHQYYHVYNRGVEKRKIFLDEQDFTVFLGLLKKYLGEDEPKAKMPRSVNRHRVPKLTDEVRLLTYCLMPNHFHLLLFQYSQDGVQKLMRRVMTGYAMYFNNRYDRVGSLFQGPYKASHITKDSYLLHISRYIHLNPAEYKSWHYSSYRYFTEQVRAPSWLNKTMTLELFDNKEQYLEFVDDYVAARDELSLLKHALANDIEKGE